MYFYYGSTMCTSLYAQTTKTVLFYDQLCLLSVDDSRASFNVEIKIVTDFKTKETSLIRVL